MSRNQLQSLSAAIFVLIVCQCAGNQTINTQHALNKLKQSRWQGLKLIQTIKTEKQPKQICFHPSRPEFYVANMNDASGRGGPPLTPGSLQIFSLPAARLLHRQAARTAVECLVVQNTLLYTDMFRDEVVFFDLKNRKVIRRAAIKESSIKNFRNTRFKFMPKIITPTPDGNGIAVSQWLAGISLIDFQTGRLIKRINKFCEHPRGLLYNQAGRLLVMCYGVPHGPGQIVVLDPLKNYSVTKKILTGGSPRHIVALNQTQALISNLGLGQIYLFDTSRLRIIKKMSMPGQPNTIVLDPAGQYLYVSLRGRNQIAVVDINQWKIAKRYQTGDYPTGLAVSPDGKYLAVSNFHSSNMHLYEILRN